MIKYDFSSYSKMWKSIEAVITALTRNNVFRAPDDIN